jgi:glucose-6-phosphate isomerase
MPHKIFVENFKNIKKPSLNLVNSCQKAADKLRTEIKNKELAAIDVIFNQKDLKDFENFSKKLKKFKKIIVLGVGGSSLGAKTISAINFQERVEFLESIDPASVSNFFSKIKIKETFFLVISKSGETIETTCQTLILIDLLKKAKVTNFSKQFLFITQSLDNNLAKIAKEINCEIYPHDTKIGGRYSAFSVVGMLPALLAGIDIKKVRKGAQKIIKNFLESDYIAHNCALQISLYERGFTNDVLMPYIDKLKNFNDWYRQLWAESLGKNNFGSTPINSMGTVDQHSQLQLYLEGPKDKFFTFVTSKNHQEDFLIKDLKTAKTLFGGKKLSEVLAIEEFTTIEVLNKKKLPIRIIKIDKLNEETLGALMMQTILEIIIIAYSKNINPFDQPAVELRKDLAKLCLKQNKIF